MPIPGATQAVISAEKLRDYLLNLDHPDGGPKAAWFHALGYTRDGWRVLADDLLALVRNCERFDTETTRFGLKYVAIGQIGRSGRIGRVRSVWVVEESAPPRRITAYPDTSP